MSAWEIPSRKDLIEFGYRNRGSFSMAIKQQVPPEAYETLKQNPDALYLDVRTEGEFAAGHPAGAINIPVMVAKGPGQMQLNLEFDEVAEQGIRKKKKFVGG